MLISTRIKRAAAAFVAAAFACSLMLTGCTQPLGQASTEQEEAGPTSRSFMAQMNETSNLLSEKMASFADAVSREELVSMKLQADAAFGVISQMEAIEAPEELADLKQQYVNGCTQLKDVLSGYLDLYSEIEASTTRNPFDYDGYPDRIAGLQASYDAAVQALESADKSAAEM